ncbi:MAG: SDR family NAD(P)-dependent oxidoreductase [Pseudomonadota bacterium]
MSAYVNKHIWIIGASSGIGRSLAVELARQGAKLILSARNEDKLKALHQTLGPLHTILPLDVANPESLIKATKSLHHIDSVIFMAGIYDPGPLSQFDLKSVRQIIDINLNGAFNTIHAALPILKKQGFGQLVLCASVAGYVGLPNGQPYSATKAALINLAESLRAEERDLDIKVINPGFVRTKMTHKNNFKMPMIIAPEKAAIIIAKELQSSRFEIHFPKRFTYIMKMINMFPRSIYFALSKIIQKSNNGE